MRNRPTKLIARLGPRGYEPQITVERLEVWLVNSALKSERDWGRGVNFESFAKAKEYAISRCDREIAALHKQIAALVSERTKYELLAESKPSARKEQP